jgi:hypothetical protein
MPPLQDKIAGAILTVIRRRRTERASAGSDHVHQTRAIAPAKVREARFSDFEAVSALKQRWGMDADSLENWERLWHGNPALLCGEVKRPIGWVLEADGALVGYMGNISLQCWYGEKMLAAVASHGLVVDTPYRAMSLTLVAPFYRQKSVDLYLSTTAIEAVGKMSRAFKCSPLPQAECDSVFFWVLQSYPFARTLMKKLDLGSASAWIGSVLTAIAVDADRFLRRRRPRRSDGPFTITEIAPKDIGDDFQSLWAAKLGEGSRLLADRSPAALRWHFEIPGDLGCARVLCCQENGKLVGYAVIRTDTDQETGLRKSIIADTLVRQDEPEIVRALWAAAYEHAKHAGSDVLEVMGFPPALRKVCPEWNPYVRKYPACPYYYKSADPELHAVLADGAAWYATPFDGDTTLIRPSYSSSPLRRAPAVETENDRDKILPHVAEEQRTEVF